MHPQRWILIAALALATGYVWLRGGFVGILDIDGAPTAAIAAVGARPSGRDKRSRRSRRAVSGAPKRTSTRCRGVMSTTSGYTGGTVANPTYRQVSSGGTGHTEAVQVVFDPAVVSYEKLLDHYWHNVDPFVANRQFCDVGNQYRPEIFFHTDAQRVAAEASKARMQKHVRRRSWWRSRRPRPFYPAEEYHQDYYKKNSAQYRFYRFGCGRDRRLQEIWCQSPVTGSHRLFVERVPSSHTPVRGRRDPVSGPPARPIGLRECNSLYPNALQRLRRRARTRGVVRGW